MIINISLSEQSTAALTRKQFDALPRTKQKAYLKEHPRCKFQAKAAIPKPKTPKFKLAKTAKQLSDMFKKMIPYEKREYLLRVINETGSPSDVVKFERLNDAVENAVAAASVSRRPDQPSNERSRQANRELDAALDKLCEFVAQQLKLSKADAGDKAFKDAITSGYVQTIHC